MKKSLIFFILCFVCLVNTGHSQDLAKDSSIDYRVKLHYSNKDLNTIKLVAPYKLKQINYMYTSSFFLKNNLGKPVQVNAATFDIYNYERFRKEKERAVFQLTREGTYLEMMSREELNAEYTKIQNHSN